MFKILDLFAGTQSVRKALDAMGIEYDYIGVDIYSPEEPNAILDLSQPNIIAKIKETIERERERDWKPDFIWASPLCTTFSRATSIKGGTLSYELSENKRVILRENWDFNHKAYNHLKNKIEWRKEQHDKGMLGLNLLNNTKRIVNYFKVPFCIENPAYALSRYELTEYKREVSHYCMYGFDYKKATAFYSNKKLELLKCNHKGNHKLVMSGNPSKTGLKSAPSSNKDRSKVPTKLIKDILKQLTNKGDK